MRHNPTRAEGRLWSWLRNRRFDGHKFRRQHPIGPYIVDFYCPALKLALESDGRHHEAIWRTQYEGARTEYLRRRGITIVRIRNEDFIRDSFMVEEVILAAIRERE
jgi:very-short-patch-repair endonuclease